MITRLDGSSITGIPRHWHLVPTGNVLRVRDGADDTLLAEVSSSFLRTPPYTVLLSEDALMSLLWLMQLMQRSASAEDVVRILSYGREGER